MQHYSKFLAPLLVLVAAFSGVWVVYVRSQQIEPDMKNSLQKSDPVRPHCIPTFVDGGGPYYVPNAPMRAVLVPEEHAGIKLAVSGRVLASDCVTPFANVLVDIWQANETGNYEDGWYRGQVQTNDRGEYSFVTVVPKGYGEGTGYRPPHIHFKIWQNSRELITSQMFLPGSREEGIEDAYIVNFDTKEINGQKQYLGTHDIILPN